MPESADGWALVQRFMVRACGVVMSDEQRYLLDVRLGPVARQHGFVSVRAFVDAACAERPGEPFARALVDAMTTHETFFFRDAAFWRSFAEVVVPRLLTRERTVPLRVWSAACSTGQEPYSVVMTFAERGPGALEALDLVASDVAEISLERARDGVFSALEVSRGLSAERLARHFDPHGGGYRIKERLRRSVRWEVQNLLAPSPYPARQDVVLCRNVLIYFGDRDRAEVTRRLFEAAAPGAFVGVGTTEVIKGRPVAPGWFVRES